SAMEVIPNTLIKGKFVLLTLLIWLLFLLIAIPQWMIMCLYAKNPLIYTLILILVGFVLLACIHIVEVLKYKRPWNFVCLLICYEILTIGVALYLTKWNLIHTLILIGVGVLFSAFAMLVCVLLIFYQAYPNPVKLAIVGFMGFILVYCIRSVHIFNKWFYLADLEVTVFLVSTVIVTICHILITNDNFELLRQDDAMHVAFVLYLCYMLFIVGCRIAAHCIQSNMEYFKSKRTTALAENFY
ncbi:hypothetical protein KR059_006204, partial [Drosophila kikkawai]